jgi:two-component system, NtrC family, nitrogen regulation sensor histidine kinase NtrY
VSYRAKVLLSITATVALAVWLVAALISAHVTRTFERRESQRAAAAVDLFRREFDRRGTEISARVAAIAASEAVTRILTAGTETYPFVNEAETLAREHSLELLTIAGSNGTIISSAHWPARFGYREEWLTRATDWNSTPVSLRREELADGSVLALIAVRTVRSGDLMLYVAGGMRLDQRFLESLPAFQGMRVSLLPGRAQPEATNDAVTDIPLTDRTGEVLATLRATQSRAELFALQSQMRQTAIGVGIVAVAAGLLLGFWAASRVTRPVRRLAGTVRTVSAGDWNARAEIASNDEIGQLARDFNQMTEQLVNQRSRMLQSERVAAWRELARRLAHELKNPLFPLQITVENLRRARSAAPSDFDEIFEESTSTLLAELRNLNTIIGRFGDFARMPAPQFESVDVNEIVREAIRLFEARAAEPRRPEVRTHLDLDGGLPPIQADPEQLRRALRNLALNGLDAMPEGGELSVRTARNNGRIVIEITDTGGGLTPEEQARLFTPYYTTKQHGTGLGLAIVQSVVSDHHGTISVRSEPDRGTTFRIELPYEQTATG